MQMQFEEERRSHENSSTDAVKRLQKEIEKLQTENKILKTDLENRMRDINGLENTVDGLKSDVIYSKNSSMSMI